ncbi:hypothetical protein YTPLAS18_30940 [Nitrospira sp.]|nr:hypothetical protein YTPLAS18_30940 [Nitrospira sp.]
MKKLLIQHRFFLAVSFATAIAFLGTTRAESAQWLAPASADHVTADWVKQIETDLSSSQYQDVFLSIPADTPIPAIVHNLNQASLALADGKREYAQSFVNDAIRVLDRGVAKGWYTPSDIEPVKAMIRARADAAMAGKAVSGVTNPRWDGYTGHEPLGLTNAAGQKQESVASTEITGEPMDTTKKN